jgi:hypothetical protein
MGHGLVDALGHLIHVQIRDGAVQRRSADEGVDARRFRVLHRLPAAVDVLEVGAGQAADGGILRALAISETAAKSPSEAMGKPASMMSTPISSSRLGDLQLFLVGHGGAGRLFAIAQGGVENDDAGSAA